MHNTWRPPQGRYIPPQPQQQQQQQRWQPGAAQQPPAGMYGGPPNPQVMAAAGMNHHAMMAGGMMGMTGPMMHGGNVQQQPPRMHPSQQQFILQQQMMQQQMMMLGPGMPPPPPGQSMNGNQSPTFSSQPNPPGSLNSVMEGQTPSVMNSPTLSAQGLMDMPGFGPQGGLDAGGVQPNIAPEVMRGLPRLVPYRGLMSAAARPLLVGRPGTLQELQMVNTNLRAPVKATVPDYSFMRGRSESCKQIAWLNDKNIIVPKVAMARFVISLLRQARAGYKPADALSHSAIRDTARRMYERLADSLEKNSEDKALIDQEPAFRRMPNSQAGGAGGSTQPPAASSCAEDWAFFTLGPFSDAAFWGLGHNQPASTDGSLRMLFEAEDETPPAAASTHHHSGGLHHVSESQREDGWASTQRLLNRVASEYGGPLGIKSVRRLGLREEASEVVSMLGAVFKNRVNRVLYLAEQQARDQPLEWSMIESCLVSDIVRRDKFLYKDVDSGELGELARETDKQSERSERGPTLSSRGHSN